nr:hypothetical protein [Tanacetum cinerariifolium]
MQVDMQGLLNATTIKDLDTYDFDCDDISNAKEVLMASISIYGSDVILEEMANKEKNNESVTAELEIYKERVKTFEQGYHNPFYLKKAQWIKPTLYDGIVLSAKPLAMPVIDDEETLILEEESRSKMSAKENDLEAIKQKISNKPIHYVKLNKLYEDFRKHFVPQQELLDDEAFWYHMLNPSTKSSNALPIKIEAPKELLNVRTVNESHKKLKLHLANFDKW